MRTQDRSRGPTTRLTGPARPYWAKIDAPASQSACPETASCRPSRVAVFRIVVLDPKHKRASATASGATDELSLRALR